MAGRGEPAHRNPQADGKDIESISRLAILYEGVAWRGRRKREKGGEGEGGRVEGAPSQPPGPAVQLVGL